MLPTYEFDYYLPCDNDKLGKHDCVIPAKAELLPTCEGIPAVVMISFRPVYATNLQRVINLDMAVRDMECIAAAHFADIMQEPVGYLRIVPLNIDASYE